jgi:predicted nucleic acid-binding protein
MTLADVAAGATVFVDANILIFALVNHPIHGAACDAFLDRAENQEITAVTSTHVLGEVVHRMMTIEAADRYGWPVQGIANRLRRHPAEVQQLSRPIQALNELAVARVTTFPITPADVSLATDLSRQTGLLYGDALIVAVMRVQNLTQLASSDADFEPGRGVKSLCPGPLVKGLPNEGTDFFLRRTEA